MKGKGGAARLVSRVKENDLDGDLWDIVIWRVPVDARAPLGLRYRMAFIPYGWEQPAVLFDNHFPKGPHKHLEGREEPMAFDSLRALRVEFEKDVRDWKEKAGKGR